MAVITTGKNMFRGDSKMPNWVKGNKNEGKWEKAQTIVTDEYGLTQDDGEKFWRLVTGIYKNMGGEITSTNEQKKNIMGNILDSLNESKKD